MISLATRGVLLCVILAGLSSFVVAAKQCMEGAGPMIGIDADGNLDGVDGEGFGRFCVNTRNGKFTIKINGNTTNASNKSQTYKNNGVVEDFFGAEGAAASKYRVSKTGKAKFTAKGTLEA